MNFQCPVSCRLYNPSGMRHERIFLRQQADDWPMMAPGQLLPVKAVPSAPQRPEITPDVPAKFYEKATIQRTLLDSRRSQLEQGGIALLPLPRASRSRSSYQ
ncbi:hypothetical protein M407DRAFT_133156 [Tulasnella calospora MUT 4182]|uniref:Uncharacterized protein n=1 Tax=Tulasnella calospora MUT 4182 TaxID=1051891 RepID=A0A0C3LBW1_9AGAM|nr:hypothetical protein M407DRAFT_133156 [Tulasnella calospora MUT 4182]